jgi:hypothetical protein
MQRCELFYTGRMNIAKYQHVFEPILTPNLIAAASSECLGIFECAKEYVPKAECLRSCWCDGGTDDGRDAIRAAGK